MSESINPANGTRAIPSGQAGQTNQATQAVLSGTKLLQILNFFPALTVIMGLSFFIITVVFAYPVLTIIKVGHSTDISLRDARRYALASNSLMEIFSETPVSVKANDALLNLTLVGIQKEVLSANKIEIPEKDATQLFEQKNKMFVGMTSKIRQKLGKDYYRLWVEPYIVNMVFNNYYTANEPNIKNAQEVSTYAKSNGLEAASQKYSLPINDISLSETAENTQLINYIKSLKPGIIDKPIDNGTTYLIAYYTGNQGNNYFLKVISVNKQLPKDFLMKKAVELKIPIEFKVWSIYRNGWFTERLKTLGNS